MRTVAPRVGFPEITLAENQLDYLPVTAARVEYSDGSIGMMTRWRLDDAERERIAQGEDLYLVLHTFGHPMQPVNLEVGPPEWATVEEERDEDT